MTLVSTLMLHSVYDACVFGSLQAPHDYSIELREDSLLQLRELPAPLVHGVVLLSIARFLVQQQQLVQLIDVAIHLAVQDQGDEKLLDLCRRDIELLRNEWDPDSRVR